MTLFVMVMTVMKPQASKSSHSETRNHISYSCGPIVKKIFSFGLELWKKNHDQLHWLNVPKRIEYKLAVIVRRYLENKAPTYLSDHCTPVTR